MCFVQTRPGHDPVPPRGAPWDASDVGLLTPRQRHRHLFTTVWRQPVAASGENRSVDLARVGWIVTVFSCLVAVVILLLQGYYGYALVTFAVAGSAAFNLT